MFCIINTYNSLTVKEFKMPDMTVHAFEYCSFTNFEYKVPGKEYIVTYGRSHNSAYEYDFSCSCQGFKFRKSCKHITEAKKVFCGWDQFIDGGESTNGKCPKCANRVESRLVAV